jgi:hypothetical protein
VIADRTLEIYEESMRKKAAAGGNTGSLLKRRAA